MKSSTSQRAGSSRTFLKTMYLTSGAYVMTRRLRASRSAVSLYARQRASTSSGEILFLLSVADVMGSSCSWKWCSGGHSWYRPAAVSRNITPLG